MATTTRTIQGEIDERSKYIPYVEVEIYPIGGSSTPMVTERTPLSDLKYVYRDENGGPLDFKFTKNGLDSCTVSFYADTIYGSQKVETEVQL